MARHAMAGTADAIDLFEKRLRQVVPIDGVYAPDSSISS
jgi:hypothetical protein